MRRGRLTVVGTSRRRLAGLRRCRHSVTAHTVTITLVFTRVLVRLSPNSFLNNAKLQRKAMRGMTEWAGHSPPC